MSDRTNGRTTVIWRDGQLIPWDEATLHVMSHVVHYGSSVFEGVRCYETPAGPAVFRLREHMRRLLDSCKIYRMPMRWSLDDLVQATLDTVAANELRACYLRPVVVRAGEQMGVLGIDVPVETFVIAWHWGAYLGHTALTDGVDVCVSSWRRPAPGTLPALAKAAGNYLNSQLSKMEARADGYAEGIVLDNFGYVSEGSGENLFVIRDGVLWTSGLDSAILEGVTRDSVVTIARDMGLEVRTGRLPRELLLLADEMFFTGTAAELTPIRSVDRQPVGEGKPGPITRAVQDRYMGIVTGRYPDAHGWLTPVPVRETADV
ncbi:branched chain amino acid aminotransferase [Gemmatimonadetes bacterium T265]|nr:branched chain amino acid aminotransferase [Gemmatimonadetes bacterium T265]